MRATGKHTATIAGSDRTKTGKITGTNTNNLLRPRLALHDIALQDAGMSRISTKVAKQKLKTMTKLNRCNRHEKLDRCAHKSERLEFMAFASLVALLSIVVGLSL